MTKEISKEVRAKVYGLYLGADIDVGEGHTATLVGAGLDNFNTIEHSVGSYGTHPYNGRDKLILSDLSDISEADINTAWECCGMDCYVSDYSKEYFLQLFDPLQSAPDNERFGQSIYLKVYDKLRELGYMLPAFGITDLFEAGIAVRKETIKK